MTKTSPGAGTEEASPARTSRAVLPVLALTALAYSMAASQVLPALPVIQEHFRASPGAVTWVFTVYLLVGAPSMPLLGRLGDMYGRRTVLLCVVLAFSAGSLFAALARSLPELLAARAVQGVGSAVVPLGVGIVKDFLPAPRVPVAISVIGAMTSLGSAIGLTLSGLTLDNAPVATIFWIAFGLGITALAGTALGIPAGARRSPGRLDLGGAVIVAGAVAMLLLGVSTAPRSGWSSPAVLALLAAGGAGIVGWVRFEARRPSPLVAVEVLRDRAVGAVMATTLVMGFAMFGTFALVPRLAQTPAAVGGLGVTPLAAGLLMLPTALVNVVLAPIVGRVAGRWGPVLPLRLGCLSGGAGLASLSLFHADATQVAIGCAVLGTGSSAILAAAPTVVAACVDWRHTGAAVATNSLAQSLGGAAGSQVAVAIVLARTSPAGQVSAGYAWAFAIAAGTLGAAFLTAHLIPYRAGRPS